MLRLKSFFTEIRWVFVTNFLVVAVAVRAISNVAATADAERYSAA